MKKRLRFWRYPLYAGLALLLLGLLRLSIHARTYAQMDPDDLDASVAADEATLNLAGVLLSVFMLGILASGEKDRKKDVSRTGNEQEHKQEHDQEHELELELDPGSSRACDPAGVRERGRFRGGRDP